MNSRISSVSFFNYLSNPNYCDSFTDFDQEEIIYTNCILTSSKAQASIPQNKHSIKCIASTQIKEYVSSNLPALKVIPQAYAEHMSQYIMISFSSGIRQYFEYNETFCTVFEYVRNNISAVTSPVASVPSGYIGTASYPDTNSQYEPYKVKLDRSTKISRILVAVMAVIFIIIAVKNYISDPDRKLTPVAEPSSGTILSGKEVSNGSSITVAASFDESCVVKLKTASGETRLSFYVQEGDTVTIGVPREHLYVYFASGDTWYGTTSLFGTDTEFFMDHTIHDFNEYTWTYTLYEIEGGNFSETPVDREDFA